MPVQLARQTNRRIAQTRTEWLKQNDVRISATKTMAVTVTFTSWKSQSLNINYCVRGGHKPARWPWPTSINGNGKVILDTHPESDQHQNWTCSRGSPPAPTHQIWWWSINPFLRYLADKNSAHRHTPMTTRPCGLRRAGNNQRDAFRGQSRLKIIKHGRPTIRYVRYGFLLVCYSNFLPKTSSVSDIRLHKMSLLWNPGQRSLKVIESGAIS